MALRPPCGGNLIGTAQQGEPEPVTALAWSASQRATVLGHLLPGVERFCSCWPPQPAATNAAAASATRARVS